jgi:hypothetical protein
MHFYASPSFFASDRRKWTCALSLLHGEAVHFRDMMFDRQCEAPQTFDDFLVALRERFGDPMKDLHDERRLLTLKQTATVGEYMEQFSRLSEKSSLPEAKLMGVFIEGLHPSIRDPLAALQFTSIKELLQATRRVQSRQTFQSGSSSWPHRTKSTTTLDRARPQGSEPRASALPATAAPAAAAGVNPAEIQCHYCRERGHMKRDCPKRKRELPAAPAEHTKATFAVSPVARPPSVTVPAARLRPARVPSERQGDLEAKLRAAQKLSDLEDTSDSVDRRPIVSVTIYHKGTAIVMRALLDTGSVMNLMDAGVIRRHGIPFFFFFWVR